MSTNLSRDERLNLLRRAIQMGTDHPDFMALVSTALRGLTREECRRLTNEATRLNRTETEPLSEDTGEESLHSFNPFGAILSLASMIPDGQDRPANRLMQSGHSRGPEFPGVLKVLFWLLLGLFFLFLVFLLLRRLGVF